MKIILGVLCMMIVGSLQLPINEREIMVKFRADVTAEARDSLLRSHGMNIVTVFEAIRVFVVRLPEGMAVANAIQILSKEPAVEYAEPISGVRTQPQNAERRFSPQEVIVKFKPRVNVSRVLKQYKMTTIRRTDSAAYLVKLPANMTVQQALEVLKKDAGVDSAEPSYVK